MKNIKNILKNIWKDESGQGATEYILMITVVVVIVFVFKDKIRDIISDKTDQLRGELGSITSGGN